MPNKEERILAWHFLNESRRLRFEPFTEVKKGRVIKHNGPVELCQTGLHASIRAIDALQYAPGPILCRVEVWGNLEQGNDKLAGSNRKCLWMVDATKALHRFATDEAELALLAERERGREPDKRSFDAIKAKRDWLEGLISDKDLAAAYSAAYSAAWSATNSAANSAARYAAYSAAYSAAESAAYSAARYAAESAAWSAANSAANSAAESAAWSAAWSAANSAANSAAESAAWSAANERLTKLFLSLGPKQ